MNQTLKQKIKNRLKSKPTKISVASRILNGQPQRKGICVSVTTDQAPKKPNSAKRKFAKLRLSNGMIIRAQLIGQSPSLQDYASVLIRGGRGKDLPGVPLRISPGNLDCKPTPGRKTSRSKYGVKRNNE